jgi:hypothetical protein
MALTQKEREKRYEDLVRRQTKLVRGMLPPQTIASKLYPRLQTEEDRRLQEKRSQQKE